MCARLVQGNWQARRLGIAVPVVSIRGGVLCVPLPQVAASSTHPSRPAKAMLQSSPRRAGVSCGRWFRRLAFLRLSWRRHPIFSGLLAVPRAKIAVHVSLTGEGSFSGQALSEAVQMAEREVNAEGDSPRIKLMRVDDQSSAQMAAVVADRIGASNAVLVIGPSLTPAAEMAAPFMKKPASPPWLRQPMAMTLHARARPRSS